MRIACLFALMIATHLAYLECVKAPGPPRLCPSYEFYVMVFGFFDITVLDLLRRPGHHRLLLASAFDILVYAFGTLTLVSGLWRFSSLQFYAFTIWLLSIIHAAMFLVPRVREYYRKPALTGPQS